jgi:hypothetical protein
MISVHEREIISGHKIKQRKGIVNVFDSFFETFFMAMR